jgi:PAS domain S-box-containing protein
MNDSQPEGHLPAAHEALRALRERAERRRQLITRTTDEAAPDAIQRLVQELQTHQIELEMQYEELLVAQAEAEAARIEYTELYDFAPIGYLTLDDRGTITQLNLTAAKLFGVLRQHLLRRRLVLFAAEAYREKLSAFMQAVLASDEQQTCELYFVRGDGTSFYAQLQGNRVVSALDNTASCRVAMLDTTSQHVATEALALSEARFRQLFEQSADAVLLIRRLEIVDCNESAMRLIGATHKSELLHQHVSFLVPEYQPNGQRSADLIQQHHATLRRQGNHRFEWFRHNLKQEGVWLEVVLTYITVGGEQIVHSVWRDITAQRAAREQLHAEKAFSDNLLDNSVDGIVALDRKGRIIAWNRAVELYSSRPEAEVLGQELFVAFPYLNTPEYRFQFEQVLRTGEGLVHRGLPFTARPGHYDAYVIPLRGEQHSDINGVLIVIRDITERNRLIEETTSLRLNQQQEVLSAILTTEEAERKRIAEALHNGVGQLLYATKLHLTNHSSGNGRRPNEIHALLDEAIRMTRTISFELTPGILEDFGLEYALAELVRRIPRRSLPVHLHLTGLEEPLPKLMEVAVYRIVQELLNNIIKHAQAQEAFIHLVREDDKLSVLVEDNGQGFEVDSSFAPRQGIGLPGLRNRVGLLGGTLTINSRPGQGTIVSIELPVK